MAALLSLLVGRNEVTAASPSENPGESPPETSWPQIYHGRPWPERGQSESDGHRPRQRRAVAGRGVARRAAGAVKPHGPRRTRPPDVRHPADHRAGLVLHDGEPDARRPRRLRLSQPLRPHVRRPVHRRRRAPSRRRACGISSGGRAARRSSSAFPARTRRRPLRRRARHVLPHAVGRQRSTRTRLASRTRSRTSSASTCST